MRSRWSMILVGLFASLALVVAACGPSAGPDDDDGGGTTTELPAVQSVTESTERAESASTGSTDTTTSTETTTTTEEMPSTSVSGKPLAPDARYGGTLQVAYTSEGPSYSNWEEAAGIASQSMHPLHNMLIQPRTWGSEEDFAQNAFFEIHPDLAQSWEVSDNGLEYTFKLRDGVSWTDGTAVTCRDIAWSYNTIRTAEGLVRSPRAVHLLAVDDVTCPDDLTVVFTLKYPKPALLEVIAQPYSVMRPAHIYEGNTAQLREEIPTVTTGPFILADWIAAEKYVYERNPNYWDQPFPYLDGIQLNFLARTAVPTALRGGQVDIGFTSGFTGAQAETLIAECEVCKFWPRALDSAQSPAVMLNHTRPPWNEPAVKEAFALAIDNEKYNQTVRQGWYPPPTGCGFYATSPWAMPAERCAQIPGYGDFTEWSTPAKDQARAREILEEAGYGADNPLKVTMRIWSIIQVDAPSLLEDFAAIGVNAEAEVLETSRAYQAWSDGDFDLGVHGFWVAGLDPDVLLYEHFYTGSDRNYNRYSNPEFDRLVDQMSQTIDVEERKQLAWDALELAMREQAKIIVAHSTRMHIFSERLGGLMPGINYLSGYGPQSRYDHTYLNE